MVLSLTLPDEYPIVLFTSTVVPFMTNMILGGKVMGARKQYDIQYPNLCTPQL